MYDDIDSARRFFARKNLEKLCRYDVSELSTLPEDNGEESCSIGFEILKHWSEANKDSINKSIESQVFGKKDDIDWNVAFLPFMESMAVYRRDYFTVLKAREQYIEGREKLDKPEGSELISTAINTYTSASEKINAVANLWGMEFVEICDLPDKAPDGHSKWSGPYCGAFISTDAQKSKPFMGLVFKGTKPTNRGERHVDMEYQLISADGFLQNQQVSQGVYTGLFGDFQTKDDKGQVTSFKPYNHIMEQLNVYATKLHEKSGADVRLHVAGHSLGGSYSTLCTAQLLIHSANLAPKFVMGDEYTFGAPRVAAQEFAIMNRELASGAEGQSWRIVNNRDIVPDVPPTDLKDATGFYHVDRGMHIWSDKAPEPIASEIGQDPPEGRKFKTWRKFWKAVYDSDSHLPHHYRDAMVNAINSTTSGN